LAQKYLPNSRQCHFDLALSNTMRSVIHHSPRNHYLFLPFLCVVCKAVPLSSYSLESLLTKEPPMSVVSFPFNSPCQGASWCDGEGTEHMHNTWDYRLLTWCDGEGTGVPHRTGGPHIYCARDNTETLQYRDTTIPRHYNTETHYKTETA
jgi:hypothetical protein